MTTTPKRQNIADIYRLSPVQQGMLLHSLLSPESAVYFEQFSLGYQEGFELEPFVEAWRRVIERHPVLRTGFLWEDLEEPVQVVHRTVELPVEQLDWRELSPEEQEDRFEELRREDRRRGFDLSRPPLTRLTAVRTGDSGYRMIWSYHHVILDGWSAGLVMGEVGEIYRCLVTGAELRLAQQRPFRDYISWLRQQDFGEARAYWKERLAGFTEPTPLVVDHPAADGEDAGYDFLYDRLDRAATERLKAFVKQHRLTLNTLTQAAYALVLARYSGRDDVALGVTVSGRPPALRGVEGIVGCFINTLPARFTVDPDVRVLDWLERVQAELVALRRFEHTPLVDVLAVAETPRDQELFESILVFESFAGGGSFEMSHQGVFQRTNYPLTLVAAPSDEVVLRAGYDAARFDAESIRRLLGHWKHLIAILAERPEARIGTLDLLTPAERRQALSEWNRPGADYTGGRSVHELVARHAAESPDRVALTGFSDESAGAQPVALTYGELARRAGQLAERLRGAGVGPETLVGLCAERSVEMVVAILGVLEAGGAYLPLDPKAPAERLEFMIEDSGAAVVLVAPALVEDVPDLPGARRIVLGAEGDGAVADRSGRAAALAAPAPSPGPDSLAYVIYTSGSTGRPKGSLIPHVNVERLMAATEGWFGFGPDDVWTLFHSYAFDFSVWELWGALAYGGRLVVVPYWVSRSPESFHELLRRERVTVLNQTPSAFKQLIAADGAAAAIPGELALRSVVFGGEALEPASLTPWFERHGDREPLLVNMYGITETTVHVTYRPVRAEDAAGAARPGGAGGAGSPVGVPIPDLQVHLLDPWLNLVPVGVPGEVHVGGAGLARGYLGRPGLTAERFIPDPFVAGGAEGGGRLYRAGDLARRLPDGELDFLGRIDQQVKVRGFRIELGEIEAVLARHPAVGQVAVVAREDRPGDQRLVAYVVPDTAATEAPEPAALREHAGSFLPDYMIPAAFVELDELPLTVNGKLDRRALPAPGELERLGTEAESEPPRTETEKALAKVWQDILGVEGVGRQDDFFDLGGHSLLATRVASRVRESLDVSIPLRALFEASTLAEAAARIDQERGVVEDAVPPILPLSAEERQAGAPLSFAQERLWFLDRMEPESSAYNVPGALRLVGDLDVRSLAASLDELVRRHDGLRTVFETRSGRPVQVVRPWRRSVLPVIDLSALGEASRETELARLGRLETERPFDLGVGPLVRTTLVRLAPGEHGVLVTMHHIVSDAWSLGIFVSELAALYRAAVAGEPSPLAELPIQYPDFAVWQRGWLTGEVLDEQLEYWRERLAGADGVLDLPTDRPRPPVQSYRGSTLGMRLGAEVADGLRKLAHRKGATLFMVSMAGFQALLARHSGQGDLVVGSTIANRQREEIQGLIGFFVNTLALRTDLSDDPSFDTLVERVRDASLGAYDHQDLPFEKLVEEVQPQRDLSRSPVFQVVLQLQNVPAEALELPGLTLRPILADSQTAKFDLILNLTELEDGIHGLWRYKSDLFDRTTVRRMADHLETLLAAVAADPGLAVSEAPLLAPGEAHQLVVEAADPPGLPWPPVAGTGAVVEEATVHGLFEAQAAAAPDAVALSFGEASLTYGALDRRAGHLARVLRERGVGRGVPVALCLERGLDMVVAILGVLKAGGAYVPLDPAYPEERLAFTLEDSGAPLVLTTSALLGTLPATSGGGAEALCLDRLPEADAGAAGDRPPAAQAAGAFDLAYVIYTSGSTGRPKGVPVTHGNAVRLMASTEPWFGFGPDDVWTLFHSYAFDFSVWELWGPLAYGGRLVVVPLAVSRSPEEVHALLARERVTVLNQTPSAFRGLVRADGAAPPLDALRCVIFGGEALELAALAPWFSRYGDRRPRLVNMYGITETTVHVTYRPVGSDDLTAGRGSVIGRPIPDLQLHLLDPRLQPVPVGVAGEIHVGGAGLARGYLARPALTAERFVPDPFAAGPEGGGGRLYRSGDLARRLADGDVEYLGRIDHQVKVRGFRIELGEIESALAAHPAVSEAVVLARPGGGGEDGARLVAYTVAAGEERPTVVELRSFLGQSLPDYMVPAAFVTLDAIPLTANGKVDRKALPEPEGGRLELGQEYVAPRDGLEERLAALWREVLEVDRVGVHDDFFDLGGNSLVGAVLINRLQEELGEIVHVVVIFDAPSVAQLAEYLRQQHAVAVARLLGEEVAVAGGAEDEAPPVDAGMVDHVRSAILGMDRFSVGREPEEPRNPPAVFVLSAPRSGSTLLRVMLGGHPGLFSPPELELLSFNSLADRRRVFSGRDAFWLEGVIRAVMELEGTEAEEARALVEGWEREALSTQEAYRRLQERLGDRLLVDKTPSYALHPEVLERAEREFEGVRYVHLVRHPYGMIRSFEEAKLDQIFFPAEHPFTRRQLAELIWIVSEQNIRAFLETVAPERRHVVRFEDLVRRPQRTLRRLCAFLGIGYESAMADPYRSQDGRMTDGIHEQSRMLGDVKFHEHRGVDPTIADRWRGAYSRDFLGELAFGLAADHGYEPLERELPALEPRDWTVGEPLPVSFAQERLWFLDQLDPGTATYNIPAAVRLVGALDFGALTGVVAKVAERQASLRTTFTSEAGRPAQVVAPPAPPNLPLVDLAGLPDGMRAAEAKRLAEAESVRPFDLARGPLFRAAVLRLAGDEHAVLLAMHHIVSDGWSMGVLVREIAALYAARSVGADRGAHRLGGLAEPADLPVQYADFALWQREALPERVIEEQLDYWRRQLAGAPVLELPTDRPRPSVQTFGGATLPFQVPRRLSDGLRELAQRAGATRYATMLAAFQTLLSRWSGQENLTVGSPFANRNRAEIEDLIGFFVNTLVLRADLADDPPFERLVGRTRETVRQAFAHQDVPFERVVQEVQPERSLSVPPLFQAMLMLQERPALVGAKLPGLELEPLSADITVSKFDLTLTLIESGGDMAGQWVWNVDLFDRTTVQRVARSFETLLAGVLEAPERALSELPLLTAEERHEILVGWNRPERSYPVGGTTVEQIRRWADETPDAVAVVFGDERLSYGELVRRAQGLAGRLIALGAGPERIVGVASERSVDLVAGLLAVLEAGASYLPIDPTLPADRLGFMLDDAGAELLLVQDRLQGGAFAETIDAVRTAGLDPAVVALEDRSGEVPESLEPVSPEAAAYVIYTSGSTGLPKGVVVSHRALANRLAWARASDVGPDDAFLQKTTISFDVSVAEIFAPLVAGGRTVLALPGDEKDTDALVRLIARQRVTHTSFPPTVLYALLEEGGFRDLESLQTVITGGETVPPELAHRFYRHLDADLLNRYGPTETTISVSSWRCRDAVEPVLPIGRPTAGAELYVLDRALRPVPVGVVGEIVVGGECVARGYLGRAARTAESFVPHPFVGLDQTGDERGGGRLGARLYRTGDLGRFRPDGALEFAGRVDQQIKIRGFRVELGEIEAVLAQHPAVREVAVVDRGDGAAKILVAYPVAEEGVVLDLRELASFAAEQLPAYMVPAAFVPLDALPLAATGKVDRKALPDPAVSGARQGGDGAAEPPRGPVEESLAAIWAGVLELERIGRNEEFFELGGHSLLATRVVSRVREAFGVDLPLRALFEAPTVAGLARAVEERLGSAVAPPLVRMAPVDRTGELPLSFAQERLWFLDQLEGGEPIYNVPLAARLTGSLEAGILRRALDAVVERHESLRTTFRNVSGRPSQVIHGELAPAWTEVDLTGVPEAERQAAVRRHAGAFARLPFDLAAGPLVRVALLATGAEEHVVLLTLHHIVSDVWSMGVLLDELGYAYRTLADGHRSALEGLPALPIQYADYAAWQRGWLTGEALDAEVEFWRERLAGAPTVLELPTDRPRPAAQTFRGGRRSTVLDAATHARLDALARERGATLFMAAFAAMATWLARLTGQDELLIGTPVANRDRLETEGLIGFFLNTLVLCGDVSGAVGFGEVLERARGTVLDAFAHQDVPFEKLVEELGAARDMSHSPLFQVMLVVQAGERHGLDLPGLTVERLDTDAGVAKFDLTLSFMESGESLLLSLEHNRDLFDPATADRFLGNLATLLAAAVAEPDRPVALLPLLTDAEWHQIAAWNDNRRGRTHGVSVHRMVVEQARRTPDAIAVEWGEERLSYDELVRRANRLARTLRRRGVGTDLPVALFMERSPDLVVGVLAVLQAGGAYLLLEPTYPPERLAFMIEDSGAPVVLTVERMLDRLPPSEAQVMLLDRLGRLDGESAAIAAESAEELPELADPESLVYLIYTSGSTGRPKGVALPHRALENLLCWNLAEMETGARTLQLASLSFDVAFLELFVTWSSGGTLVLLSEDQRRDVPALARLMVERRVEKTVFPVLVLQQLAEEYRSLGIVPTALREVTSTGEQLQVTPPVVELFERLEGVRLHNHYGPSESHVVTALALDPDPAVWETHPPIGTPIDETEVHLLDRALQPVPVGVPGELYIAGVSLARGYIGRPALTAERFVPDPLSGAHGGRAYRAGDLARYRPDGVIEYLGRIDHQVKIRGFRVEPGEVESALAEHPAVRETVVVPRPDPVAGGYRLVAYVVPEGDEAEPAELRSYLGSTLPDYMVPSAFVTLAAIPLNPNGKIDRKALPEPEADRSGAGADYAPPRTAEEELLANIWAGLLGVGKVGIRDDFFALGGHSLLATQLLSRMREAFGVEPPLRQVFENPTIEALAALVERERRAGASGPALGEAPPLEPADLPAGREGAVPVSFSQERLWFLDRLEPGSSTYNMPTTVRLEGRLDVALFAAALDRIAQRHGALRTTFHLAGDRPVQVVAPAGQRPEGGWVPVRSIDLSGLGEAERERSAVELAARAARRPFDLERGPLARVTLLRLGEREHVAVLAMHHIVTDGWSMGILLRELAVCYRAALEGCEPELPSLPVQYTDYALWQRRWLSGDVLAAEIDHWRETLAGAPAVLTMPTDRPRPPVQRYRGRHLVRTLRPDLVSGLEGLARNAGSTLFMVLLAAFDAFVHRHTGQDEVVVGTPVAGRTRREVEGLIGFFLNSVVLRVPVEGGRRFRDLLADAREVGLEAFAHQEVPFERLVEELAVERTLSHAPLFQMMLVFQSRERAARTEELSDLVLRPVQLEGSTAKFDLTVNISETDAGLVCRWMYNSDLFDATTIERWTRRFTELLRAAVAEPERTVGELPLMAAAERQQLLEWNDSATIFEQEGRTLHGLIAERTGRMPDAIALEAGAEALSYRELERRADALSLRLRDAGVAAGDLVGLCAERSVEMVVALLGILRAGAAYVPLDPDYPGERLAAMLEDSRVPVLLVQQALRDRVPAVAAEGCWSLALDGQPFDGADTGTGSPRAALRSGLPDAPDAPAYAIFTSGSTGRPKGVVNAHRGVVNRLAWMESAFGLEPGDRVLQKTPYSFDVSVWELFWPLIEGATLVMARPGGHQDTAYLVETINRSRVTTLHFVPSMLQAFLEDPGAPSCTSLRRVIASGEALPPDLVARAGERLPAPLHNLYGPTEAAIDVTWWPCPRPGQDGEAAREATVPIGRPVANTGIYILDRDHRPVAPGVAGELVIGGAQVARGYLRRPALTAERFVPDPFARAAGARLYRTGDLARHRPDGAVEYLGRLDHQVKLRGFRIELGEIEAVLAARPEVRETVVVLRGDLPGGPGLAAYLVPADSDADADRLELAVREALSRELPGYMVPAAFVVLPELPLNPNGKVDRKALPAPHRAGAPRPGAISEPPRDALERELAGLFAQALGRKPGESAPPIGIHDDFFDLGGNSIAGAVLINRLQERLGEIVHVVALFDAPTVAGLATYLAREYPEAAARLWGDDVVVERGEGGTGRRRRRIDERSIEGLRSLVRNRGRGGVPAPKNRRAVFVLSPPRSGSTLLRVMLGGHPALFAPPELELLGFASLADRRQAFSGRDAFRLEGAARAVMEACSCGAEEAEEILARFEAEGMTTAGLYGQFQEWIGDRLLVDKTPTYAWDPDALWAAEECFEEPRYIHLVRHPYGMIHSFEEARVDEIFFGREHPFDRRELAEASWLLAHRNIRRFFEDVPEERRMVVRFEELLGDPEGVLRRMSAFLGVDYRPEMAEPYAESVGKGGSRMTDGVHAESRMLGDVKFHQHKGVDASVAERWRESYREDFLGEITWSLAGELGYDASDRPGGEVVPLERIDRAPGEPAPLSFAQERLWFIDRMEPASAAYNIPAAFRLTGRLAPEALERALATIVERHAVLRTRFAQEDGRAVQIAEPPGRFRMRRFDISHVVAEATEATEAGARPERRERELRTIVGATSNRPFDLEAGGLFRASLVRLGEEEHVLLLVMHHIVGDGWSVGALFRELTALYTVLAEDGARAHEEPAAVAAAETGEAAASLARLPELPIQYADYAVWQRSWLAGVRLERELDFWRRDLEGVRPLELPTDRPRPAVQTYRGAARPVGLSPALAEGLRTLGRGVDATPFMALSALFAALLSRLSGQDDLTVGTPVANRTRGETEPLIGLFANTLVLRFDLAGDPGFRELLSRTRSRSLGLFAHQDVPFEKVVEELRPRRDLARSPLFQVMFALQNARGETAALPELTVEPVRPGITAAKFELTLSVAEGPRGVVGGLEYNRDLFDATTVERMIAQLRTLAEAALAAPDRPLADLPLLSAGERHQLLVDGNDTARADGVATTVPEWITARAEATPRAPAVTCGRKTLTYQDLEERSNRLGRRLCALGVVPGDRVGICLERSEELVVAALAVLKAGGAYVPLDPAYPEERLVYVLEDSGARVLLAEEGTPEALAAAVPAGGALLRLDADAPEIAREPAEPLGRVPEPPDPDGLAYVIYTSGSTGRPKGVEIPHRAFANFLLSMAEAPGLDAGDVLVAVTTLSFDIAGLELFGPLVVGGHVVVARREATVDGERLAALLDAVGATVLQATPATWRLLLDSGWRGDRHLTALCGGEALPPELAGRLAPRVAGLWNMYGPTETTVWSSTLRIEPGDGPTAAVPVGGPIANTSFAVLDRRLRPVPFGVPGELAIGGTGVARGYHGRPDLTAGVFVPDPWGGPGSRLYRTGDLVRARTDGRLEFLGRIDHQVKVRGHRIELGEIEAALALDPAVGRAVAAVQGPEGARRLVAYVVLDKGEEPDAVLDAGSLREALRRTLPDYMVPSAFVALDELPLTPNGKVDRKALPDLGSIRLEGTASAVAPRTETERRLATLWQELLSVDEVGARDDFFALGGHSLLLVELNRRLRQLFGREVPVVELFRHPTLEALAAYLDRTAGAVDLPPGVMRLSDGATTLAPLFLVHPLSGELSLYRPLVDALGGDRPVYGFQARGLEQGARPDFTVEEMAERYARALERVHPEGPVLLAGSSMGGLVVYEMARALAERGRDLGFVAMVDTPVPGARQAAEGEASAAGRHRGGEIELALLGYLESGEPEITLEELGEMVREERLAYVLERGHRAGTLPASYGLDDLTRLVSVVEANRAAMDVYRPATWDGRLVYFRAADGSAAADTGDAPPWSGLALEGVELHEVPGNHISLHSAPNVERLATGFGEYLERVAGREGRIEGVAAGAALAPRE